MKNTTQSSGGIGFIGLLTIVFITLKLTGFIDWSWWWVISPVWIVLGIVLAIVLAVIIFAVIETMVKNRRIRRR